MIKTDVKKGTTKIKIVQKKAPIKEVKKSVKTILITQPKPESDRSPYFELERKFNIQLDFHPFVRVEGISGKDFRKQKVDIQQYTAIIFTSRNAIDHFFRIAEEMKTKISGEMKYFCITESIALYLQKFILYRKRKVFYGDNGTIQNLMQVVAKYKSIEKFLVPANDINKHQITEALEKLELEYAEIKLYDTCCNNAADILKKAHDMIVFFSPGGVKALFESIPKFKQKEIVIGAFGPTTTKAAEDAGLNLELIAPMPNVPSMVTALDIYFSSFLKKGK
jgi:uroporphyrinogen-III synthase